MGSEIEANEINEISIEERGQGESSTPYYFEEFSLYQNEKYFYMVGSDNERKRWQVLKIGRSDPSKLVIEEDPTVYSSSGPAEDMKELHKLTGGHEFVTKCYGIVGFIRFSGPEYIILITKRTEIGRICGHPIYTISEYRMIPIHQCAVWSYLDNLDQENRYMRLLCIVDITKDFFFSYSYPIMHSLQKNLCLRETRPVSDGMFVWNKYLTSEFKHSTRWAVALVHGYFKQIKIELPDKFFYYTLIARRSCQYAGPRYEKRGVNAEGQAANEVEIEQIASRDINGKSPSNITSSVQTRSSIPLRWFQEYSWFQFRPDIQLSEPEGDNSYEATKLHFLNLRLRYGKPIVVFTLLKTHSEKSRELSLHKKYEDAVEGINKNLHIQDHIQFLPLDLDAVFRREGTGVLNVLTSHASRTLEQVGFYSGLQRQTFKESFKLSLSRVNSKCACSSETNCSDWSGESRHQKGILRTNCLDSLDRTNAAQYVYAFVALVHQLVELQIMGSAEIDFDQPLAHDLMILYEAMGDALSQQYGGSAAQSKIFSKIKGQCKTVTRISEMTKTIHRHYSNLFMDVEKQVAINMFLGHFKPDICESEPLETPLEQLHTGLLNTV